jgi:hypothetical protein
LRAESLERSRRMDKKRRETKLVQDLRAESLERSRWMDKKRREQLQRFKRKGALVCEEEAS